MPKGVYTRTAEHNRINSESKKGKKLSEATKKKISISKTGKHLSEETKKKISGSMKGKNTYKRTEATKKKMSIAQTGKNGPMFGRTGEKHPNYGKHLSEETKKKISESLKGKKHSEETKKKMSDAKKGKKGRIGVNASNYKGDDIKSMSAIHKRVRKLKPLPVDGKCKICNKISDKEGITKLHLSNIKNHQYTLNPDDYQYAHRCCHMSNDMMGNTNGLKNKKAKINKPEIKNSDQIIYWLSK